MKNITIPLEEYAILALKGRTFAYVDVDRAAQIVREDPQRSEYVCENDEWTTDVFTPMTALGKPAPGLMRFWRRKDWETADNRRKESLLNVERLQQAHNEKVGVVVSSFVSKGIPQAMAETIVKGMTTDVLNISYQTVKGA
jgi:hypothetical protein